MVGVVVGVGDNGHGDERVVAAGWEVGGADQMWREEVHVQGGVFVLLVA